MSKPEKWRLPSNVKPVHYALQLTPDLTNFVFTGHVDIDITVEDPSPDKKVG
jgi:aminopeptidase 2